ncbi:Enoyl-CoA hydratase/carnithine racemase [Hahella chejuensis KCTC 2396]|uniref:Enoyl-CoA hydratase/carnithine racemase n=1 Tax=Hahella chejuensis (strain KCTC 2396) TaxID=349521 RepID=Q2SFA9_HAHCH|nr:enoyl-CoA hydratase/isomerase family protein [Hahella chejuensis]ABC30665.1 Enoyl-CoA hydratase/carnithine racemase [Hahella chejuensis KCTC 2396]
MSEPVLYRVNQGVAEIVLNRPEKHNAFNAHVIQSLNEMIEETANDSAVRIVVLRSEGKHFSAGADLEWMRANANADHQANLDDAAELARLMRGLFELSKPTIARVQGSAFGGALGLISCCDIAIASARSKFCLSEVKLGILPAVISPYVLRAIGPRAMQRYTLTAELFDAKEALRLGLIHEIVEETSLDAEVELFTRLFKQNGPNALFRAKALLRQIESGPIDDALVDYTTRAIADVRVSPEGQEGLSAFLEKRPAAWTLADGAAEHD